MTDKTDLEYYEVGGSVRDLLMNRKPNDRDYVVIGETKETMEQRGFQHIDATSFPVFHDENKDEWALARTETKTGEGYHGFETQTENVTLEQDLERRDFTINSMARDPETGKIIDPFDGKRDIKQRQIRHVSDAFSDDPVRVLRAARFANRLKFTINPETVEKCNQVAPELKAVPNERIGQELIKALEQGEQPHLVLGDLLMLGALQYVSPDLCALREVEAGPEPFHHEDDAFIHTQLVMREMQKLRPNDPKALLMAMLHDIGKTITGFNRETHGGHDKEGIELAEHIVTEQLKLGNDYAQAAREASRQHMRIHDLNIMKPGKIIKLVNHIDNQTSISMEMLLDLAEADEKGRYSNGHAPGEQEFNQKREELEEIIEAARKTIEKVDAAYSVNKRDAEIDDYPGEVIGQMITQDRVEHFKANDPRKVRRQINDEIERMKKKVEKIKENKEQGGRFHQPEEDPGEKPVGGTSIMPDDDGEG